MGAEFQVDSLEDMCSLMCDNYIPIKEKRDQMTNKEAIEELKKVDTLDMPARLCEAHYMAIKALEQKPCEDAISREDLEECKELMTDVNGDTVYAVRMSDIRQLPPVNPQEQKTGHWILDETDNSITCDKCGCLIWANDISNGEAYYCPNCGARMGSEDKE